jgi:ssDNA-binding Zn-finger/Zn-ribbon topoisomerase 1
MEQSGTVEPAPICPRCEQRMVLRAGRGSRFYGCSTFPRCGGTRPLAIAERPAPAESHAALDLDRGTPGGSAQREYERRIARREERVKGRFGRRIGGAILAITDEPAPTRAWARGAEGERELANALAGIAGVQLLHDRRVPGTRGNIDHLVVGPAGIFVVDAKLYEGLIRVRDVGGLFRRDERLYVGRRDCSKLAHSMAWQVNAVQSAIVSVEPVPPVTPVLCFVRGEWPLFGAPDAYAGVRLEGTKSLRKLVTKQTGFTEEQVGRVTAVLAKALPAK